MKNTLSNQHNRLLLAGFLSLAVVMGIGRFAYTPIFPYMELDDLLTPFSAGLLATFNYIGYFIGALGARYVPQQNRWLYIGLLANVVTTFLMGMLESYTLWAIFRLISGITSGMVFVIVSNLILSRLNQTGKMYYSGYLYGGVGFGICISGAAIPTIQSLYGWEGAWVSLGLLSVAFMVAIFLGMWKQGNSDGSASLSSQIRKNRHPEVVQHQRKAKYALYISYTGEGFGYIIFGTFITAMLVQNPSFTFESSYVWAIVGVGAIPSCLFWSWLGTRLSSIRALKWAYMTQIISILIPVFTDHLLLTLLSALGFGATFMGITTLTLTLAKSLEAAGPNLVSGLTAAYAIGQLLGPVVAGTIISVNDFAIPFMISAVVLVAALITINFIKDQKGDMSNAVRKHQSH
ncbi:MAG: YbfB/YjiJ family MFS transporter [Shouchella clausii]|jgi:MFS family permease